MTQNKAISPYVVKKASLAIGDRQVHFTIKRSVRARNVRIEIRPETGLSVILPRGYSVEKVEELIRSKSRWIALHLEDISPGSGQWLTRELQTGDTVPFLGESLKVVVLHHTGEPVNVQQDNRCLYINMGKSIDGTREQLNGWYKKQAHKILPPMVNKFCARMNVTYNRLYILGQNTRWGSCSHKKNISLNWKLLKMPQRVIEYVIIHELAHLKEMNHTPRFWEVVAMYCQDWRECRAFLKKFPEGKVSL